MQRVKGISGSTIKLIGMITMLIDHIAAVVLDSWISMGQKVIADQTAYQHWYDHYLFIRNLDLVMRLIGRIAFPIFIFLLVEGFKYTHSKLQYAKNLFVFALLSEIPFDLAFKHRIVDCSSQNVFFTLFLALVALCVIEHRNRILLSNLKGKSLLISSSVLLFSLVAYLLRGSILSDYLPQWPYWLVCGIICGVIVSICLFVFCNSVKQVELAIVFLTTFIFSLIAILLNTDYGGWGVLSVVLVWYFASNPMEAISIGCCVLTIKTVLECTSFFAVFPIKFYNGLRGLKLKYVFYLFYPLHLLVLTGVIYMLGLF